MTDQIDAARGQARPALVRILLRVVRFPLTRIVIALVAVAVALIGVQVTVEAVGGGLSDGIRMWLAVALAIGAVHLVYTGYVRLVERRPVRNVVRLQEDGHGHERHADREQG